VLEFDRRELSSVWRATCSLTVCRIVSFKLKHPYVQPAAGLKWGWIVRLLISAVCALTFCLLTTGVWADSVPIVNASFETTNTLSPNCNGLGCAFNFAIPDWTPSFNGILNDPNAAVGSFRPGSNLNYFTSPLPNGIIVAFINSGAISQTLGVSVLPNATYTLSVDVGRRVDVSGVNYSLNLYDGSISDVLCSTGSNSNSSIAAGTFKDVTLTCTTGSSVPVGLLGIELTGNGRQVNFDNVQLNVTNAVSTPEPSALALTFVGLFVGGLLFLRSRRNQYLQSAS